MDSAPAWRAVVESNVINGATVDRIPLTKFPDFPVRLPKLPAQERIANILSAYDNLIEDNRRRIQLLEQAARLLYREWFVHLRFPGHEHVKIKDGVPERWEMIQVKDILAKVKRPRKIKKEEYLEDGLIPCVDQSREFIGGYTDDQEAIVNSGKPVIVFGDHTRILKFIDFPGSSRECVHRWRERQTTHAVVEVTDIVLCSAESIGLVADHFGLVVEPFHGAVADRHVKVVQ